MELICLRFVFILVAAGLGVHFLTSDAFPKDPVLAGFAFCGVLALAAGTIAADMAFRRKRLDTISAVYFGLLVGLFLTYIISLAFVPLELHGVSEQTIRLIVGMVVCYLCISLLLQTRNDFRFVIPYVEFAKEVKGAKPWILDTSVVIDGRIADVIETHVVDGQLIMPKFVIDELQAVADSSDRLRRGRGRRGLDVLNRLRGNTDVDMVIYERELPEYAGLSVDQKLVALAKHLQGKLITNDYNLNKVARVQGVAVINLNDIANALKPVFLPGEHVDVRIVKAGEEPGQGVGYLDDGTMVVVESGRDRLNQSVHVAVTSVLQTSAGRMVFGKVDSSRSQGSAEK
jgi:uncharacterized protein YacL